MHCGRLMGGPNEERDANLARECLEGSEVAWQRFYGRYIGLVRVIVRRKVGAYLKDLEDVTQNVFTALVSSLDSYDPRLPLDAFVSTVAARVSIQEYRRIRTAKRDAKTNPVDHHDGGEEGAKILVSALPSQEDETARSELVAMLREGIRSLDGKCRELLRLKYYDEFSYNRISEITGVPANTLAVRTKRCMDELRIFCRRLLRRGSRP
jgi:RNA polymerase sigma-70 factor (ECF subfamily)